MKDGFLYWYGWEKSSVGRTSPPAGQCSEFPPTCAGSSIRGIRAIRGPNTLPLAFPRLCSPLAVMSFLAPLFLLGALAVAAPIIFHLIRRTSREKMPFSSLMFLQPTPPRVTRSSRLENIFLLLLRCLVLCLLALGFARPFFQKPVAADHASGLGSRIVILVDASASMKRDHLWADARAKAGQI